MSAAPLAGRAGVDRIVLFDGVCGFCDVMVRWLMARDPEGRLHYAPLQGETVAGLRRELPAIPDDLDTVVLVERDGGGARVWLRSEAVFRILRQLSGPWRHVAVLGALPRPLTDLAYRLFAKLRYRLFGRLEECRIPRPEERERCLP